MTERSHPSKEGPFSRLLDSVPGHLKLPEMSFKGTTATIVEGKAKVRLDFKEAGRGVVFINGLPLIIKGVKNMDDLLLAMVEQLVKTPQPQKVSSEEGRSFFLLESLMPKKAFANSLPDRKSEAQKKEDLDAEDAVSWRNLLGWLLGTGWMTATQVHLVAPLLPFGGVLLAASVFFAAGSLGYSVYRARGGGIVFGEASLQAL